MKKIQSAKPFAEPSDSNHTDEQLIAQAQFTANAFAKAYNRKHGVKLPIPVTIDWNLHLTKPKVAGMAHGLGFYISLNMALLREYPREIINRTIPHEIAHLAEMYEDNRLKRKSGDHGLVWASMMASMAQPVLKYHGMNTKNAVASYKAYKKANK